MNHYKVQPTYNVFASNQGRDLAGVAGDIDRILDSLRPPLPRGTTITVRGQVQSMRTSFIGLAGGLVFAILLVYFLMVVNFQSWTDPLIIAAALPGALAGILWMLYAIRTTVNVPSLMGAIMAMGVGTANSILAVVGEDSIVHYPAVGIGRDYGTQAEILSGLMEGDRVLVNPTTEVKEGQKVRAVDDQ